MSETKYCPDCGAEISYLKCSYSYRETAIGYGIGTTNLDGEDDGGLEDHGIDDYIDHERYDFVYNCPECNYEIELGSLLDEDPGICEKKEEMQPMDEFTAFNSTSIKMNPSR